MDRIKNLIESQTLPNGLKTVAALVIVGLIGATITLASPDPHKPKLSRPVPVVIKTPHPLAKTDSHLGKERPTQDTSYTSPVQKMALSTGSNNKVLITVQPRPTSHEITPATPVTAALSTSSPKPVELSPPSQINFNPIPTADRGNGVDGGAESPSLNPSMTNATS